MSEKYLVTITGDKVSQIKSLPLPFLLICLGASLVLVSLLIHTSRSASLLQFSLQYGLMVFALSIALLGFTTVVLFKRQWLTHWTGRLSQPAVYQFLGVRSDCRCGCPRLVFLVQSLALFMVGSTSVSSGDCVDLSWFRGTCFWHSWLGICRRASHCGLDSGTEIGTPWCDAWNCACNHGAALQ